MSTATEQTSTGAPEHGLAGLVLDAPGQPQVVPVHPEQPLTASPSAADASPLTPSLSPAAGVRVPASAGEAKSACFHCGEPCPDPNLTKDNKAFCCRGCLFVHDLLAESGLGQFYDLSRHPGVRVRRPAKREQWAYLDDPALQQQLLDFTDGKISRVTFQAPAIHCVACVWLLENLFRLQPGIGRSQVNFPRREVTITFATEKLPLSDLVALLASIGYEPVLTLGELEKRKGDPARKRQWLQIGIAGFAFGNIMLLSLPAYVGLDSLSGPLFKLISGYLSLALAAPVLLYSASDYWRSAWLSLRQRVLTLDVPIALGLAALYAQSAYEVVLGRGNGYLDSLAALVFFLLCGRVFQQKTHDRMAFDRDYKCFFPLSVTRVREGAEESVAISNLQVGDKLRLRNGELIPADGRLLSGPACIDYSFVTGEAETVPKAPGDYLYAGGRQTGGAIEIETVKAVSQSQLTSLWNHEAFQKQRDSSLNTLTNRYSRRFTLIVIAVAVGAAVFWVAAGDAGRGLKAFTSVLIVACPCALALAAPFTLGTAQRLLARIQVFVKNTQVIERMAQVDAIVFDKTGTLTAGAAEAVRFRPAKAQPVNPAGSQESRDPRSAEAPVDLATRESLQTLPQVGCGPLHSPSPQLSPQRRGSDADRGVESRTRPESPIAGMESSLSSGERVGVRGNGAHESQTGPGPVEAVETQELRAATQLSTAEESWVCAITRQSTHPLAVRIGQALTGSPPTLPVEGFVETPGCGIKGRVGGREVRLGSRAWLEECGVPMPASPQASGSLVCLAIDGTLRGEFVLANAVRPETGRLLRRLGEGYTLALLSGDNEKERQRFRSLFASDAALHFNQSPLDKLGFIRGLQDSGQRVMMVGDGLNDAGALKQSDVGVAVVEQAGAFSPASDVILEASRVPRLAVVLSLAGKTTQIVRLSFGVSAAYNLAGITFAAAGILSPVICAILMPVSSISVVLFACGATNLAAKRAGLTK